MQAAHRPLRSKDGVRVPNQDEMSRRHSAALPLFLDGSPRSAWKGSVPMNTPCLQYEWNRSMAGHLYIAGLLSAVEGSDASKALTAIAQLRRYLEEREAQLQSDGDQLDLRLRSSDADGVMGPTMATEEQPTPASPPALRSLARRLHSTGEEVTVRRGRGSQNGR